jgi:hypothetical protein
MAAMPSATDAAAPDDDPRMRRAVVRIEAESRIGELAHVGAPDDDRARAPQSRDGDGIGLGGRRVREQLRACARGLSFDIEQILDRDGNARERRQCGARAPQRVEGVGGGAGVLGIDMQKNGGALSRRIRDPFERRLDERAAGRAAVAEIGGELGKRGELRRMGRHGVVQWRGEVQTGLQNARRERPAARVSKRRLDCTLARRRTIGI